MWCGSGDDKNTENKTLNLVSEWWRVNDGDDGCAVDHEPSSYHKPEEKQKSQQNRKRKKKLIKTLIN